MIPEPLWASHRHLYPTAHKTSMIKQRMQFREGQPGSLESHIIPA